MWGWGAKANLWESQCRCRCILGGTSRRLEVCGDCSAHPGPHPFALRATAPACGCPKLFQTILSNREGSSTPPSPPDTQNAPCGALCVSGGEGGIRTLGTLTRTPDFESGTFDHSATSPEGCAWSARAGKFTRRGGRRQAAWGRLASDPNLVSRPFSWPAAARCRRRYPGSATAIRYLVPSAIRPGRGGRWDPDRKCRCTCLWRVRS